MESILNLLQNQNQNQHQTKPENTNRKIQKTKPKDKTEKKDTEKTKLKKLNKKNKQKKNKTYSCARSQIAKFTHQLTLLTLEGHIQIKPFITKFEIEFKEAKHQI